MNAPTENAELLAARRFVENVRRLVEAQPAPERFAYDIPKALGEHDRELNVAGIATPKMRFRA